MRPLPRFQPVVQDFAVVVDEATPAGTVQRAILTAAKPLAESARLFDIYRGEQIPAGQKSLAFEVTFAAPNRALAEHELTRLRERIATTLRKQLASVTAGMNAQERIYHRGHRAHREETNIYRRARRDRRERRENDLHRLVSVSLCVLYRSLW